MSFEFVIKAYAFQSLLLHAAPGLGHREDHGHEALHIHAGAGYRAGAVPPQRDRSLLPMATRAAISKRSKISKFSAFFGG